MGCKVDNLNMEETLGVVEGFIHAGTPHQHVVVNVDKIVKASRDPALRQIINDCDLINADGMPVVWASRLLGKPLKERVTGVDLFEALMAQAATHSGHDPDRISFVAALRITRQTLAHPGAFPP